MEFKIIMLFFLLIFVHLTLAFNDFAKADINQVRKQAIQRCDNNVQDVRRLIDATMSELGKREEYLGVITKNERQYGDAILAYSRVDIGKYASSAWQMATVKFSPDSVFRCIEVREKEGNTDLQKYFDDKFLKPGSVQETSAGNTQKDELKKWNDYYVRAARDYSEIYTRAVREISNSNSESQIAAIVNDFDKYTREMSGIVTSINFTLAKIQAQTLQVLDRLVADLKVFSRTRVDKTIQLIQDCLKKSFFIA